MKKLYEARLLIYSFGLLLSSTVERFITNAINERLKLDLLLYHALSLVILIVLFIITNVFLKLFIHSKAVSKKVFGNKYVGGRWVELIYDDSNVITGYCNLHIIYDADEIILSGTNYDINLKVLNSFETKGVSMENYCLSYLFIGKEGNRFWQGLGNLTFERTDKSTPKRYSGYFIEDNRQYRVEGVLINGKNDLKNMDADFVSAFRKMLPDLEARIGA